MGGGTLGEDEGGNILLLENPFEDSSNDDFRLSLCSDAIDGGDNSKATTLTADYYNNSRIENTTIDMGAIENVRPLLFEIGTISGPSILFHNETGSYTTNGVQGGTWSISGSGATINPATGVVTADGTTATYTITYSYSDAGCSKATTFNLSVNEKGILPTNNVIYVDANVASSSEQTGSSWADAVTELADALKWAKENEANYNASNILKIYVAEGTYSPLYSPQDGVKFGTDQGVENSFLLVKNTQLYGGFSPINGAEDLITRDWNTYPTILDGNDAVYHVVVAADLPSVNIFDGFVVQGGNGNSNSNYNANSKEVYNSRGGGLFVVDSDLTIQNTLFRNNNVTQWGGALCVVGNKATKVINSIFANNTATTNGLAIFAYNTTASFEIINSTFYNNSTTAGSKSAIAYYTGIATVSNSIFYGGSNVAVKQSGTGNAIYRNSYFNVANWNNGWGTNQTGNIFNVEDPFIDSENGDFNISLCSEAVNSGNSILYPAIVNPVDYNGNPRIFSGEIDMGAFETQTILPKPGSISGYLTLNLGATATYTTNGDVGGVWSSKEGIIQIDVNGHATVSNTRFGQETIYYSFEVGSCVFSAQFSVNVPAPTISPDANNILYVDSNNTTNTPDGASWSSAIPELADALKWAKNNESTYNASNPLKIYVAEGTYSPKYSSQDGANFGTDKGAFNSFMIPNNVKLYGGFSPANGANDLATRDWVTYSTILDGKEEVYVVFIANNLSADVLIDGFTIQGGKADAPTNSTYYSNTKEVQNYRGAGIQANYSSIVLMNLIVKDNYASQYGGGFYAYNSNCKVINCLFVNNEADIDAAAIFAQNTGANFEIINSTFYNNGMSNNKNSIGYYQGSGKHKNSIFQGAGTIVKILSGSNPLTNSNCYFVASSSWNGSWGTNSGSNIISSNIPFVDADSGDFNLNICSSAINAGNDSFYNFALGTKDLVGNDRVYGGTIDMGAIERQQPKALEFLPIGPFCTTEDAEDLIVNISGGVFSGAGVSNGKFDPQIAGEGVHEVTYTITEGVCVVSETIIVEVDECISTDVNTKKVNDIEIYPNPAKDVINVTLSENSYVQIIDLTGRVISNQNLTAGPHTLPLSGLNEGVYLLQVLNGENKSVHKFVKK